MTSKVYYLPETKINFLASGGDAAFTLTSLGTGAGRQSAEFYRGAETSGHPSRFRWRAWCKFATTPVVGQQIKIYLKTSDGTHDDNDDGASDAAVSAEDKLKNLKYLGSIIVDEASSTPEFSASGLCSLDWPYVQAVWWNATDDALSSTAADHGMYLEEVPLQGQDT